MFYSFIKWWQINFCSGFSLVTLLDFFYICSSFPIWRNIVNIYFQNIDVSFLGFERRILQTNKHILPCCLASTPTPFQASFFLKKNKDLILISKNQYTFTSKLIDFWSQLLLFGFVISTNMEYKVAYPFQGFDDHGSPQLPLSVSFHFSKTVCYHKYFIYLVCLQFESLLESGRNGLMPFPRTFVNL